MTIDSTNGRHTNPTAESDQSEPPKKKTRNVAAHGLCVSKQRAQWHDPNAHPSYSTLAVLALLTAVFGQPSKRSGGPGHDDQHRLPGKKGLGPLRFRPDGTFHISIFEDLHFGESESRHAIHFNDGKLLTSCSLCKTHGIHGAHNKTCSPSRSSKPCSTPSRISTW